MTRQKIRKLLLFISLLLFPITIFYFSPALIVIAGLEGTANGSLIVFGIMLISSIFFSRLFCAYICPAGGVQECLFPVNDKTTRCSWKYGVKYIIWAVWVAIVIFCFVSGGGIRRVDFLYQTEHGVSIANAGSYIIYYGIVLMIVLPALIGGKRAFCHYFCWMAPFMVIGMKMRKLLRLPALRVGSTGRACVSCKKCNRACPMSLDVATLATLKEISDIECIQCGACVDSCPRKALAYKFIKS